MRCVGVPGASRTANSPGGGRVLIGISGWRYGPWRGAFYPKRLPQRAELQYASQVFPSIELNGTFYSLQRPQCFQRWYRDTPPGFVFAVKGGRFITHMKRLREIERPLANFFASGLFHLREKLGPILWQFPPDFRYEPQRLEQFFKLLPRDTDEALQLARRRDSRVRGRASLAIDAVRSLRHAIEIRHPSFIDPDFVALLRRYAIGLVVADTAGKWPYYEDLTADFVYVRLHGDTELYVSGYSRAALARWAKRIEAWSCGTQADDARLIASSKPRKRVRRDVYCYFDNDAKVKAPFDAASLRRLLGQHCLLDPGDPLPVEPSATPRSRFRPARRGNVARSAGPAAE